MKRVLLTGVLAFAVVAIAVALLINVSGHKKDRSVKSSAIIKDAKKATPSRRSLSKGMGGLTVKLLNCKDRAIFVRGKAFRSQDKNTSIFTDSFLTNSMVELEPGLYDVELETLPAKLYKGIKVSAGEEKVEEIPCPFGALNVKAVDKAGKETSYAITVIRPKSRLFVTRGTTNRDIDIMAGIYNVEIASVPKKVKNDVAVEAGKVLSLDAGLNPGSIYIKAADKDGKETRCSIRLKDASTGDVLGLLVTNRASEVLPGMYTAEVLSNPVQVVNNIKVVAGEEAKALVEVSSPPAPKARVLRTKK